MTEDGGDRCASEQNQPVDLELDEILPPPSNKKLLCIAFVSFQSFALVQLGAAIFAGSEAMLGDSVAMMVDALTYLFNLVAERQKEIYANELKKQKESSPPLAYSGQKRLVLEYRKYTYQLELIPPLLSVSTLLFVTILVLKESIHTLVLDSQRDASMQSDPNVNLMVIFSALNLLLDVINVGCFASASHALGYNTDSASCDQLSTDAKNTASTEEIKESVLEICQNGVDNDVDSNCDSEIYSKEKERDKTFENESSEEECTSSQLNDDADNLVARNNDDSTNLNMCSAYTHVFADTLRSFAVILASLLAKFTDAMTSEVADAAAAVVVSILIFLSLFPLIGGMIQTFKSLRDVNCLLKIQESEEKVEEDQIELLPLV